VAAALSNDLRERVVKAYVEGNDTYAQVGVRFGVGEATVDRWVSRYRRTGSVTPDAMGGNRNGKFDAAGDAVLRSIVEAQPDATRIEIVEQLARAGLCVSPAAVQRRVVRLKLTRKKRRSMRQSETPFG
jgi:putative transposase